MASVTGVAGDLNLISCPQTISLPLSGVLSFHPPPDKVDKRHLPGNTDFATSGTCGQ